MTETSKRLSDPPPYQRLRPGQIDNVGDALMALTRELWVLTDRMAVLEAILASKGVTVADEIDRFQPDPDLDAALKLRRDRLITLIEAALSGG